jgi:hypothetical protein
MPQYRAYLMSGDHTVGAPYELICDNDDDAIARARRLDLDWDIEIWQLDRLVIRLPWRTSSK